MYVTDVSATALAGPGDGHSGFTAICRFGLDADCDPINKQLFAWVRSGIADGIHIDDYERVWTAEYNGIVVRNSRGKELGVSNSEQLLDVDIPIANFALAENEMVIGALDRIRVVQFGHYVTTPASQKTCGSLVAKCVSQVLPLPQYSCEILGGSTKTNSGHIGGVGL